MSIKIYVYFIGLSNKFAEKNFLLIFPKFTFVGNLKQNHWKLKQFRGNFCQNFENFLKFSQNGKIMMKTSILFFPQTYCSTQYIGTKLCCSFFHSNSKNSNNKIDEI